MYLSSKLFFLLQYIRDFYNETIIESYDWIPDDDFLTVLYSFTVSIFAIGGMAGALLVGRLVTRYGRSVCVTFVCITHAQCLFTILKRHQPVFSILAHWLRKLCERVESVECASKQERDSGEIHLSGVYSRSSYGLQQRLQDACYGHLWTLRHGSALR